MDNYYLLTMPDGQTFKFHYGTEKDRRIVRARALRQMGKLAAQNLGQEYVLSHPRFPEQKPHICKKIYADDDPRWDYIPMIDECRALWAAVINKALYDATCGKMFGKGVVDADTRREQSVALGYLKSATFVMHAQFAGFEGMTFKQVKQRLEKVGK